MSSQQPNEEAGAPSGSDASRPVAAPSFYRATDGNAHGLPGEVYFYQAHADGPSVPPKDQGVAVEKIEEFAATLRVAFIGKEKQQDADRFFRKLLTIAQGTFADTGFSPNALKGLDRLKREVEQSAGGAIKAHFALKMVISSLIGTVIVAVVTALVYFAAESAHPVPTPAGDRGKIGIENVVRSEKGYSIVNTGVLVGAGLWGLFIASVLRNLKISFDELVTPNIDLVAPWIKQFLYGTLMLILALMFQAKLVTVEFGSVFSTARISEDVITAAIIGLLLGLSERALPREVLKWSAELIRRSGPTTDTSRSSQT